jgi:hypothetical protein
MRWKTTIQMYWDDSAMNVRKWLNPNLMFFGLIRRKPALENKLTTRYRADDCP